ncbi:hypothetical protein CHARACLAT_012530 [Characodon lateralis]|uniref:Uncharacterized protein n=1 Tax=Characodon lateralis TaxID=208331 RepID=A0ABU7ET53_9TELE|nr:hypothetical protein [Characodon lateralis]
MLLSGQVKLQNLPEVTILGFMRRFLSHSWQYRGKRLLSANPRTSDHGEVSFRLDIGAAVTQVVRVCPGTGGLPVQTPLSVSVVMSLGKTLHQPCLLKVVRGPSGTDCMAICHSAQGQLWLPCSLPLSVYEWVND